MNSFLSYVLILSVLSQRTFSCNSLFGQTQTVGVESCAENEKFHEQSGRCFDESVIGNRGPCGENMILVSAVDNPKYMQCDCIEPQEGSNNPPFVYHPKTDQCFEVFTRGPCDKQKWIQVEKNKPRCVWNPCFGHHSQADEDLDSTSGAVADERIVWFNNACTRLGSPCNGGKVGFGPSGQLRCIPRSSFLAIGAVGVISCPKNTYRTPDGSGCQEAIDFDFF